MRRMMTQQRPFRFGVAAEGAPSREQWVDKARRVEDLGYATFLVADHFVNEFPPLTALLSASDATNKLRVGSFVFDNDFRHPALLAKEAATLDLLSGGRLEFGIGAGWHRPEYEQVGLPFEAAGVRISRLEEAIQIIKRFFSDESVTFSGNHYKISDLKGFPKPVQHPYPPFFIGGGGKRLLTLAAREADIVGIHLKVNADGTVDASERTEAALAQKVEWVRQAAGERFEALELNLLVSLVAITDDRRRTAEHYIRERELANATPERLLLNPYLLIGSVEQVAEDIQLKRGRFGISYFVVYDEHMEAFAPVVARLAGE
jgi:probable F420-dependent oxidoreductase